MAFPTNFGPIDSVAIPGKGFVFTPTDNTNLVDPNLDIEVLGRSVTTRSDGNLSVTYVGSPTAVVVPMLSGVRRSMQIIKIAATGTTAQIVTDGVVVEY